MNDLICFDTIGRDDDNRTLLVPCLAAVYTGWELSQMWLKRQGPLFCVRHLSFI